VDELNANLGVARAEGLADLDEQLVTTIQSQLFTVGAELATPDPSAARTGTIGADQISWLERNIDQREAELPPLKEFVLPGGTRVAARLHVARCVCRRAERQLVRLASQNSLSPHLVTYVNRLSDLLFVLARTANHAAGHEDERWQKEI
jgi:cob(I)alamin adenosyltransferase